MSKPRILSAHSIGTILVLLGAIGFSTKAILVKLAYTAAPELDPITLMALRMAYSLPFYVVVLMWLSRRKNKPQPLTAKQRGYLIIIGLLGYYLASLLDFLSLQYISAAIERLVLYLYPTMVVLISAGLEKRKIRRSEWLALSLSYIGIALVIIPEAQIQASNFILGVALVFASGLSYSLYMVGNGQLVHKMGSQRFTSWSMIIATTAIAIHAMLDSRTAIFAQSLDTHILAIIMALISTVLAAYFLNAGIHRIGAAKASLLATIGPISTIGLSNALLGESMTLMQWLGSMVVIIGVMVTLRSKPALP